MLREICSSVQLCNHMTKIIIVDWDSAVSMAICYGLEGPGIESQWGRDFPHTDQPWGPPSLLYNGYQVFPRGKAAGAWH